ncbi:hypothetical protein PENTCL1PPCAC_16323, partial [Pristionchus entomophagus]
MVNCLVCGKTTVTTHMGMNACRACSVFYRRNHDLVDDLLCITGKGDCKRKNKSLFSCRKCRLDRIEAMMRAGIGEGVLVPAPSLSPKLKRKENDVDAVIETPPTTPRISIIDKIRTNLEILSAFRCSSELKLRGIQSNAMDDSTDNYSIVPTTYQFVEEATKVLISGLFEFALAVFPEFGLLSLVNQWLLIRNYEKIFHCIDAKLRARRRFGKGSSIIFGTYTTVLSEDFVEYFFSKCKDKRNSAAAVRTFRDWLEEYGPKIKREVDRVDPTEDEFLAMIGLALWNLENMDASDQLLTLAARYRTEIMADLSTEYRRTMGIEKGTSRIGILMCLLHECRRIIMTFQSNHALYIMLGAMDENSLVV